MEWTTTWQERVATEQVNILRSAIPWYRARPIRAPITHQRQIKPKAGVNQQHRATDGILQEGLWKVDYIGRISLFHLVSQIEEGSFSALKKYKKNFKKKLTKKKLQKNTKKKQKHHKIWEKTLRNLGEKLSQNLDITEGQNNHRNNYKCHKIWLHYQRFWECKNLITT